LFILISIVYDSSDIISAQELLFKTKNYLHKQMQRIAIVQQRFMKISNYSSPK